MRPAKTAAPIKMPFGLRTRVGPGNHVLDGVPYLQWEGAILRGKGHSAVICAKTTEPIEMPFGLWVSIDSRC